jgi:hypothetical protein
VEAAAARAIRDRTSDRLPAIRQRLVRDGTLRADDDIGTVALGEAHDGGPQGLPGLGPHLLDDLGGGHVRPLDLEASHASRHEVGIRHRLRHLDADVDPAVLGILVPARGDAGARQALRPEFGKRQARHECAQVSVAKSRDVVTGDLEHPGNVARA